MRILSLYFVCFGLLFSSFALYAKHPVILISLDGFAQDYLTTYSTPNIHNMMNKGLTSDALLPVYPSKTFPNHLSIITGLYPVKHGIIHNRFYLDEIDEIYRLGAGEHNSAWLTAEPIWSIAEKNNITSAVYFWPESTAKGQKYPPTYNRPYNKNTPNLARIEQIIDWLKMPEDKRPQLIISYFSLVDTAGHHFGRGSNELKAAIEEADNLIGILLKRLTNEITQPVDFILVSDHGMVQLNDNSVITWQQHVPKTNKISVVNGQTQLLIYSKDKKALAQLEQNFNAFSAGRFTLYYKNNFPKHWHWQGNNSRLPDLVIEAKAPFIFQGKHDATTVATHGYDIVGEPDLNAIFIAYGPNFKANKIMPAFENVNVASLILHLLAVKQPDNFDGSIDVFLPYLKNN